jgi:hypothetical protein
MDEVVLYEDRLDNIFGNGPMLTQNIQDNSRLVFKRVE